MTCATSTCRSCISSPARSASRAPSRATCWSSICSTSARCQESQWGFNGFFSKKNGGGFLTDHFPLAQKSIWDFKGLYTSSRHVPGVNFAGLIHPGLIGCLPDPQDAGDLECKREVDSHRDQPDPRACRWPIRHSLRQHTWAGRPGAMPRPRLAAEGARTVPPREHGGNCDIKDLSRGSKIYFPVYVTGGGLSMGDLHFSQGDGEITFCGAIEMAGWLHLKVDVIKDGMAKYGIKNPDLQAVADHAELQGLSDLRGHLGRRAGQAALSRCAYRLSAGLPERDRVPQEVRLFRCAGLFDPGNRAGARATSPAWSTSRTPARRLWLPTEIFDFDINPSSAGPIKHIKGVDPDAALAGHSNPCASGMRDGPFCRPASTVTFVKLG